ncbi:LLM class flavin-dependent oxidoreductase [Streptacidiphilus griseoplanus]|uniref:LLM class flavin-dependent oxidoreductase n=1 Tax=Peterkaempfera griseoplana TaxID=66896 RepID=UPI0006E2B078|nr:LLM class flavin-dependent oxidoreductase [Peterkaempfera griseoplana]
MNDYGHPLSFGLSLDPAAESLGGTRRLARLAEDAGLDYLAVQDHPYQPGHLDSWTLIGNLAADTNRISLFTDVSDLQLRPPTMLAKVAASLSVLTDGRIQLGVGGGAFADGIASMGGLPRRGEQMVAFTEESLGLMREALAGGAVQLQSPNHSVSGYRAGPVPPKPVEIWLGAQGPKMLAVAGRSADGWVSPLNIYVPPEQVPSRQHLIDEAATAAGRTPKSIRRIYNVIGVIGAGRRGQGLVGDVHQWVDTLTEWAVVLGFDTFVFWPVVNPESQLALFASEVVPAVRERVEAIRNGR